MEPSGRGTCSVQGTGVGRGASTLRGASGRLWARKLTEVWGIALRGSGRPLGTSQRLPTLRSRRASLVTSMERCRPAGFDIRGKRGFGLVSSRGAALGVISSLLLLVSGAAHLAVKRCSPESTASIKMTSRSLSLDSEDWEKPELTQSIHLPPADGNWTSSFASTLRFATDDDLPESAERELEIKRIPEESFQTRRSVLQHVRRWRKDAEEARRTGKVEQRAVEEGRALLRDASTRLDGLIDESAELQRLLAQRQQQLEAAFLRTQAQQLECSIESKTAAASCMCTLW